MKNIFEGEYDNQHCFYIELDYLGKYEYIFDEFKSDENFQYDVINSIYFYLNSYGYEIIKRGLLPLNSIDEINIGHNNENNSDDEKENYSEEENKIKLMNLVSKKFKGLNTRISNKKRVISNSLMKIEPHCLKKTIEAKNYLYKFLFEIKNLNKELITINFSFSTGQKYQIQCGLYITIDKLISYFLEKFNIELTMDEIKKELLFFYKGINLNEFNTKTIKELKIEDSSTIYIVDNNNVINHEKSIL